MFHQEIHIFFQQEAVGGHIKADTVMHHVQLTCIIDDFPDKIKVQQGFPAVETQVKEPVMRLVQRGVQQFHQVVQEGFGCSGVQFIFLSPVVIFVKSPVGAIFTFEVAKVHHLEGDLSGVGQGRFNLIGG